MDSDFETRKARVKSVVKTYPDFPKKGVNFLDYFSILAKPEESKILNELVIEHIEKWFEGKEEKFNVIVGLETRGFFLGQVLSAHYNLPFVPIRKQGKLPGECVKLEYGTEYSKDCVEIQKDSLNQDSRVLIVDDLLATGGTLKAAEDLVKECGATVAACFIIFELVELQGKSKVGEPDKVISLFEC